METQQRNDAKGEALNDSWVELHFQAQQLAASQNQQQQPAGTAGGSDSPPPQPTFSRPVHLNTQMEKLLLEAQRDASSRSSRSSSVNASMASSRGSPKSPHSPNNEPNVDSCPFPGIPEVSREGSVLLQGTDWIWDWSSRPEALPPSDWGSRFKHPKRHKLSVRNTRVMASGPFCLENLPTLLFTHACTFLMGAAVMFIYLKKYCQWSAIATPTTMD